MRFKDFRGRSITLSEDSWQHTQEDHPEVSLAEIAWALAKPDEVRRSSRSPNVELYYAQIMMIPQLRYRCVVVKVLRNGDFISSAMTTTDFKNGVTLYKKT